ncbi:MAG: hypothetical protein IJZ20_03790 [Clostridia bacterium]|nr:hypothetical protein [Clostridia bacterium]
MDDLMQKIQGILNDKESMEQLNQLASMFSSPSAAESAAKQPPPDLTQSGNGGFDIGTFMSLQKLLSQSTKPDRSRDLLIALKPLVKDETKVKIDRILSVFKILSLLPILKESGLLGGELFGTE